MSEKKRYRAIIEIEREYYQKFLGDLWVKYKLSPTWMEDDFNRDFVRIMIEPPTAGCFEVPHGNHICCFDKNNFFEILDGLKTGETQ